MEAEKLKLQEMYEQIIQREVHKIEDKKDKEKKVEIKKAKEDEAKRIQQILELKYKQEMQQKEKELKNKN